MKIIETSKGKFGVINTETTPYPFHMLVQQYGCDYVKLSEITEEQASEIVKQSYHTDLYAHYVKDIEVNMFCYESAIQVMIDCNFKSLSLI